jgi:hypothetical protein
MIRRVLPDCDIDGVAKAFTTYVDFNFSTSTPRILHLHLWRRRHSRFLYRHHYRPTPPLSLKVDRISTTPSRGILDYAPIFTSNTIPFQVNLRRLVASNAGAIIPVDAQWTSLLDETYRCGLLDTVFGKLNSLFHT